MTTSARIVTVTGTKGKTTVVRALQAVIERTERSEVLRVDTQGAWLGSTVVATYNQSKYTSGLVPTVCPGRFLLALKDAHAPVAVLEASVGSSRKSGLGYRRHEIGIFTNVFDDHVGMADYLKNRRDLAEAKSFIFRYIGTNGYAVYNADEQLIRKQLKKIDTTKNIQRIACTLRERASVVRGASHYVTIRGKSVVLCDASGAALVRIPIRSVKLMLNGSHEPSLYNGMLIIAALWAYAKGSMEKFQSYLPALREYEAPRDGGRLVLLSAPSGVKVLLDFAHEAESLKHVAAYARTLASNKGRVIGVVRLSSERTNARIKATTKAFSAAYDGLVIFDKDLHNKSVLRRTGRVAGQVPELMRRSAKLSSSQVQVVLDEEEALQCAAKIARQGDVVVYIAGSQKAGRQNVTKVFEVKEKKL